MPPAVPPPWYRRPGAVVALTAGFTVIVVLLVVAVLAVTSGDGGDDVATALETPSPEATAEPTAPPTPEPTAGPTVEATATAPPEGTPTPVATPTAEPTAEPTPEPTPTQEATATPEPSPTAEPGPRCSASGLDPLDTQLDLPAAVDSRRAAIADTAIACDVGALSSLAGPDFTASFGGGTPEEVWAAGEQNGEQPLWWLVEILRLPYGTIDGTTGDDETIYVWPSAHSFDGWDAVPSTDRQALLDVYTTDDLDQFAAFGAYSGYRVGITESGRWIFFVAGD